MSWSADNYMQAIRRRNIRSGVEDLRKTGSRIKAAQTGLGKAHRPTGRNPACSRENGHPIRGRNRKEVAGSFCLPGLCDEPVRCIRKDKKYIFSEQDFADEPYHRKVAEELYERYRTAGKLAAGRESSASLTARKSSHL